MNKSLPKRTTKYREIRVMKYFLASIFLGMLLTLPAQADGWSLLGIPSNSYSSYSYGMVPSSNTRVYTNNNQGYYQTYQNSGYSLPSGINIYQRPHVHGCNAPCYGYGGYGGYGGYTPYYGGGRQRIENY